MHTNTGKDKRPLEDSKLKNEPFAARNSWFAYFQSWCLACSIHTHPLAHWWLPFPWADDDLRQAISLNPDLEVLFGKIGSYNKSWNGNKLIRKNWNGNILQRKFSFLGFDFCGLKYRPYRYHRLSCNCDKKSSFTSMIRNTHRGHLRVEGLGTIATVFWILSAASESTFSNPLQRYVNKLA